MSDPFVAEIRIVGFNFAPTGWAFCNGQILPISQNTALFSLLGTTYGGDGRSTFALPNLQGAAAIGSGHGPGLSPRNLGEQGGSPSVALIESEMPSHPIRSRPPAFPPAQPWPAKVHPLPAAGAARPMPRLIATPRYLLPKPPRSRALDSRTTT